MSSFEQILEQARAESVTDIHLKAGMAPIFRRSTGLAALSTPPYTEEQVDGIIREILTEDHYQRFLIEGEADAAYSFNQGRVRVNCYRERGKAGMAIRIVPAEPPKLTNLGLSPQLSKLSQYPDGLVIIAGPTGSGKSTTLAGVVNELNRQRFLHIVTIEDPIEYVYVNDNAIITQREVGTDTKSFDEALRRVLRQDPDAIVIGEARDRETMRTALAAAETGHLVYTTLHTVNVRETVGRILELFPFDQQDQVRHVLSGVLRGIVVQRMLPKKGGGRVVAQEILFATNRVIEAIRDPAKTAELDAIMAEGRRHHGMQTLNQSLVDLVSDGKIEIETALLHSQAPQDLRLLLHKALGVDPLKLTSSPRRAPKIQLG